MGTNQDLFKKPKYILTTEILCMEFLRINSTANLMCITDKSLSFFKVKPKNESRSKSMMLIQILENLFEQKEKLEKGKTY